MDPSLRHTSLSCTHYRPGDDLGKLLAYVALAPILTVVYQFSKVYTRREVHEALLLAALVTEEALARILKALMKHPRPATCKVLNICHSHGMPSSHTSMMFCYFTITTCLAVQLFSRRKSVSQLLSGIEQLLLGITAVAVGWSRVYLGYHSIDQVLAGAAVGIACGLLAVVLLHISQPLCQQLLQVPVLRALGVKNTYGCAEPLLVEQRAYDSLMATQKSKTS